MERLGCPYLKGNVALTDEREQHIAARHPDLLPEYRHTIAATLFDADQVRRSTRNSSVLLFSRWFEEVRNGKFVVVVVMTDARHWIITACMTRELSEGEIVWQRS